MTAKIILNDEDYENIEKWAAYCTQEQICDQLSFDRRTLQNIFDRDEKALSHYKKGKAEGARMVGSSLFKKAIGDDTTAAIFYAKTQMGWKEAKDENEKALNVNVTCDIPDNTRIKNNKLENLDEKDENKTIYR